MQKNKMKIRLAVTAVAAGRRVKLGHGRADCQRRRRRRPTRLSITGPGQLCVRRRSAARDLAKIKIYLARRASRITPECSCVIKIALELKNDEALISIKIHI